MQRKMSYYTELPESFSAGKHFLRTITMSFQLSLVFHIFSLYPLFGWRNMKVAA